MGAELRQSMQTTEAENGREAMGQVNLRKIPRGSMWSGARDAALEPDTGGVSGGQYFGTGLAHRMETRLRSGADAAMRP